MEEFNQLEEEYGKHWIRLWAKRKLYPVSKGNIAG
jgi:hypothetical protein